MSLINFGYGIQFHKFQSRKARRTQVGFIQSLEIVTKMIDLFLSRLLKCYAFL